MSPRGVSSVYEGQQADALAGVGATCVGPELRPGTWSGPYQSVGSCRRVLSRDSGKIKAAF